MAEAITQDAVLDPQVLDDLALSATDPGADQHWTSVIIRDRDDSSVETSTA